MKPKLLLCLALVLGGGLHCLADTNAIVALTNMTAKQRSHHARFFMDVLRENGSKVGCHFTLEYQSDGITGNASLLDMPVKTDLNADSVPSLVSKLRDYLDGFIIVRDSENPKVVHIIEKVLADEPDYVLNKRINVKYSGSLDPTNVPDMNRPGSEVAVGGLLAAVAEKAGRIRGGSLDSTFMGMAGDHGATRINVNATNETVRSILTDCLPANYNPIMWRAVTAIMPGLDGKQWVLVQFFGQRNQNKP